MAACVQRLTERMAWRWGGRKQKTDNNPLKNNGLIEQTVCLTLQLLLGGYGMTALKGTG